VCVQAKAVLEDLKPGDSVNIDGACQTVVAANGDRFWFESVEETLHRTTLGTLKIGNKVNLERAMRLNARLGGHLMTGHIDGTGTVVGREDRPGNVTFTIEVPKALVSYVAEKGSIGIDGISLTVASAHQSRLTVSVIPYTLQHTAILRKRVGDRVNLEADILAKYVDSLLGGRHQAASTMTEEWLKEQGF
jgi:riboflavin synthase